MFYNRDFACGYDELITYYPVFYCDVREMKAILSAHGKLSDNMQTNIEQVIANSFIDTADEATIARLEAFLHLEMYNSRTLEERRNLVKSFFRGFGKVSASMLKDIISSFTSGEISIELIGGIINISVTRDVSDSFILTDCLFIVGKRIPAHLGITFKDILLPMVFKNKEKFNLDIYGQISKFQKVNNRFDLGIYGQIFKYQKFSNKLSTSKLFINIKAKQNYSFKGEVVIDNMFCLDGSFQLNGTKKLNASITKEEL